MRGSGGAKGHGRRLRTGPVGGLVAVTLALLAGLLLAGCGASGPAGSAAAVPGGPGVTVAPPVDAGASATAGPSIALPGADAARDAVFAFATFAKSPDASYRVSATLVERFRKATVKTEFTAAVHGEDYRGSAKSGKNTVGFAYVGGQGWAKPNKSPWMHMAIHQMQADDAVRPWETLCWLNDLAYTGRPDDPVDGYAFACPAAYQFQNRRLRSVGAHGRIDVLTLVLAADGTPVSMHVEGEHPGLNGEAAAFELDLRFKDVGKPITIKAP